jgi:hypothetical protein
LILLEDLINGRWSLNKTNEFLIRKEYKKWIDEGWKKFDFNQYTDFKK